MLNMKIWIVGLASSPLKVGESVVQHCSMYIPTNLLPLLLLLPFKCSISVFSMLAVIEFAAHYVKGYTCKLYRFTIDLFGFLPVESVISFSIIYGQLASKLNKL